MRLRLIRCEEEGWVDAGSCAHWNRKCPRAKKAKKASHKLKAAEPGYEVLLVQIDGHVYKPDVTLPSEMDRLKREYGDWHDVPNNQRYADCECGMPWIMHQPWYSGEARYVGRWDHGRWVPAAPSKLIVCGACGLLGAVRGIRV